MDTTGQGSMYCVGVGVGVGAGVAIGVNVGVGVGYAVSHNLIVGEVPCARTIEYSSRIVHLN